jgi:hypothetical protein
MFNVICKYSIAIQAALCHIFNFEKFHKQQKSLKTSPKYKQVRQWRVGRVDNCPPKFWQFRGAVARRITVCPPSSK